MTYVTPQFYTAQGLPTTSQKVDASGGYFKVQIDITKTTNIINLEIENLHFPEDITFWPPEFYADGLFLNIDGKLNQNSNSYDAEILDQKSRGNLRGCYIDYLWYEVLIDGNYKYTGAERVVLNFLFDYLIPPGTYYLWVYFLDQKAFSHDQYYFVPDTADFAVDIPEISTPYVVQIKINNVYQKAYVYMKINGKYVPVNPYIKINGVYQATRLK